MQVLMLHQGSGQFPIMPVSRDLSVLATGKTVTVVVLTIEPKLVWKKICQSLVKCKHDSRAAHRMLTFCF